MSFARGDRIIQRFRGNAIVKERAGVIVGKAKFHGNWLVKFDDDPSPRPRLVPVFERDIVNEADLPRPATPGRDEATETPVQPEAKTTG